MTQTVLPAAAATDAWRYALSRTAQSAFVLWAAYTCLLYTSDAADE